MPSIVLGSICLIVALLLSVVNMFTAPIIAANQNAAANAALLEVLPEGKNFEEMEITSDYPDVVTAGYKADGGYVFRMSVVGYKSGLIIMCGVDSDGKVAGVKHIQSSETYGMETELNGAYTGDTLDSLELVLATGATANSKTSRAYYDAIKAALQSYVIACGGSVDTRTPEQILQDNCNAALGTSGVTFTKWFATEVITGIDSVYVAANNGGYVFVIGESFIGVNASGEIVTAGVGTEASVAVSTAYATITASSLTELDLSLFEGIDGDIVKKISVTDSGNYVFELSGKGYDSLFEYSSGKISGNPQPIIITLSISNDGKIIDCLTVKHAESSGFGDVCATEDYYDQYRGKENSDIKVSVTVPDYMADQIPTDTTDVGAIASATYTTVGYQKAVKAAFAAFEILTAEGGNE